MELVLLVFFLAAHLHVMKLHSACIFTDGWRQPLYDGGAVQSLNLKTTKVGEDIFGDVKAEPWPWP